MLRVRISRRINYHLLGGSLNQMVSSRAYAEGWVVTEMVINLIFFWDNRHCRDCFVCELNNES